MRVCCGIIAVVVLLGNVDSAAAQGESLRLIWDRLRATLSRDLKSEHQQLFPLISAREEPRRNFLKLKINWESACGRACARARKASERESSVSLPENLK